MRPTAAAVVSDVRVIDGCVHHHWESQLEAMPYLSAGWQHYLSQPSKGPGSIQVIPALPHPRYRHPDGDEIADAKPDSSANGSARFDRVTKRHLPATGVERAVLSYGAGMYAPLAPSPYLAHDLVRALNDWTIDRWLDRDDRLYGLIMVPNQSPEASAAEIHRLGGNARMVGVLMGANGLGQPFGHPVYHPIYAAAAEYDLPVVIRAGGDAVSEVLTHPTAGGMPTTYAEYSILQPQAVMTHLVSIITQGIFVKYPSLRVIVQDAGVAWLPSLFWRFDTLYYAYRRETPWVTRFPSEYLRDHIRICTNPFDVAPTSEQLIRAFEAFGGMEDLMIFGSGFPHWDTDTPAAVAEQLPESWRSRVLYKNALAAYRWDVPAKPIEHPDAVVGEMR